MWKVGAFAMKPELHHLRPVLIGQHCIGHLALHGPRLDALNREDRLVGTFPDLDAAARKLQSLAAQVQRET